MRNLKQILSQVVIILMLLLVGKMNVYAEASYKQIDPAAYEDAIENVEYEENIEQEKATEREPINFEPIELGNWAVFGDLFKALLILFVVLGLAYVVFRIFDEKYGDQKVLNLTDESLIENLEEHIHDVDLHVLLARAIKEGNFKLAVRINYLIIIKALSNAEMIVWKKQKTNGEYMSELFGHSLFEIFKKNTVVFERVWYGDVEINHEKYLLVKDNFDQLLAKIDKSRNYEVR